MQTLSTDAGSRDAPSAARAAAALRPGGLRRVDARAHGAGAPRGAQRLHGADRRRIRHRQGSTGALHPSALDRAPTAPSSRSTAPRFPRTCSRRCCSAGSAARSPARTRRMPASSNRRRAARCCSMRSPRSRCRCRPSCCACCRSARSSGSGRAPPWCWTSASSRPPTAGLREEVAAGRFREDLYYRLNVFPHHAAAAALAARRHAAAGDAAAGVRIAARAAAYRRCIRDAAQLLLTYAWPGNVRELENVMQRALVLCDGDLVRDSHIVFEPPPAASHDAAGQAAPIATGAASCLVRGRPAAAVDAAGTAVAPVPAAEMAAGALAESLALAERRIILKRCAATRRASVSPSAWVSARARCATSWRGCGAGGSMPTRLPSAAGARHEQHCDRSGTGADPLAVGAGRFRPEAGAEQCHRSRRRHGGARAARQQPGRGRAAVRTAAQAGNRFGEPDAAERQRAGRGLGARHAGRRSGARS